MGELFVQESAVTSEKENNVSSSDNRKKVNVKDSDKQMENKTKKATYSHDEAVEASIQYFKDDELAARVWANKCIKRFW
jgi:hypothetical protein